MATAVVVRNNIRTYTTSTDEIYNPGHNILALFNNLAQIRIATSKTKHDI